MDREEEKTAAKAWEDQASLEMEKEEGLGEAPL